MKRVTIILIHTLENYNNTTNNHIQVGIITSFQTNELRHK